MQNPAVAAAVAICGRGKISRTSVYDATVLQHFLLIALPPPQLLYKLVKLFSQFISQVHVHVHVCMCVRVWCLCKHVKPK